MAREEILAAIKQCAEKLGRTPSLSRFKMELNISHRHIRKHFGSWKQALQACGMEPSGSGCPVSMEDLFKDWAGIVRSLGRIPGVPDYGMRSKYSVRPLLSRFGTWKKVAHAMYQYALQVRLHDQYRDVLDLVASHQNGSAEAEQTSVPRHAGPWTRRVLQDRPVYGAPLLPAALAYEPVTEDGVIFVFGVLAQELGFSVTRIQKDFPDCEAVCEVQDGKWQKLRIEFELASKNFLEHMHNPEECDLIVCWVHNWRECPVEVLEMRTEVRKRLALDNS